MEKTESIHIDPISFPILDAYSKYLDEIDGISFTPREIDIIACLLSGRAGKKMASFLSISPKTVEAHIRNIMLKLDCRSQVNIIDFIEKSGKFNLIKKHYSSLLIKTIFESELKKISVLLNNTKIVCMLVCSEEQKDMLPFLDLIANCLEIAGITILKVIQTHKLSANQILTKTKGQQVKNVFYLSLGFTKFLETFNSQELAIEHINLAQQKNFYSLVFDIFKKILPNFNINNHILVFQKQYESLNEPPILLLDSGKKEFFQKRNSPTATRFNIKQKKIFTYVIMITVFFIGIFSASFLTFKNRPSQEAIHWNIPRQDHVFIGREILLKRLHETFQSELSNQKILLDKKEYNTKLSPTSTLIITAFEGLGGIGKTQLALQYVYNTHYKYKLKAWFPAENIDQLSQKYMEFAKTVGYTGEPSINSIIFYIKEWLKKNPGWLLVYDNVNTYKEIAPFLPEDGGHIIITTRQRDWPAKFNILSVDLMSEKEATNLVSSLTTSHITEKEMLATKELVKILGYLPLALAQASAYIKQNQISILEYLKLYKNHEQELLANTTMPEGTNSLPVAVTWNMSLAAIIKEAQLNNEHLLVNELFTACAYLTSEKISRQTLFSWFQKLHPSLTSAKLVFNNQIRRLWLYSMINFDGNEYINVHRLVQAILRHQHKLSANKNNLYFPPFTKDWYETLFKSFHGGFRREIQRFEEEASQRDLLPHLQSLIENYHKLWPNTSTLNYGEIIHDIGYIYSYYLGNSEAAKIYLENALIIKKSHYGLNHIETATLLTDLGIVYKTLGDVKKAKELLELSLEIQEKNELRDSPQMAIILTYLSTAYRELGEIKKAKELSQRAVTIQERHHGPNHFEVATSLSALGIALRELGESEQAKKVLTRALTLREQHYGKEHFKVAISLTSLGVAYRDLGELKKAQELLERALKIREHYYGPNHFQTAITLTNLGNIYRDLGKLEEAKQLLEKALEIREQHYGKKHPITAITQTYLGFTYKDLKNISKAKELFENALDIRKQHYGNEHYETALNLYALGDIYAELNQIALAKEYFEQALTIQKSYYGEGHPIVANTLLSLEKIKSTELEK